MMSNAIGKLKPAQADQHYNNKKGRKKTARPTAKTLYRYK